VEVLPPLTRGRSGRRRAYHVEIGQGTHRRPIDGAGFDGFDPRVVGQQHAEYGDTWAEAHGKGEASSPRPRNINLAAGLCGAPH